MNEDFFTISDILNNGLFNSKKGSFAIKFSTIFSFWPQIAGKKFAKSSKPYSIKGSKIFVTCENSFVVQELVMYKSVLIEKLKVYSEPLGINISDIAFDYKNWSDVQNVYDPDEYPQFYSDEKLDGISVNEDDFRDAFLNIEKSGYLNDEQKKKFKERILKLQRAKILRLS